MDLIKKIIRLALLAAIAHAIWRTTPVYWSYVQFKDEVREIARFSSGRSDREIRDLVFESATRLQVPLDPQALAIGKTKTTTAIDASYVQGIEVLPKYFYYWDFDVTVDVIHARPVSLDQVR